MKQEDETNQTKVKRENEILKVIMAIVILAVGLDGAMCLVATLASLDHDLHHMTVLRLSSRYSVGPRSGLTCSAAQQARQLISFAHQCCRESLSHRPHATPIEARVA